MLAPALRPYMALNSSSMAYDLALPIVALPIIAHPIVANYTFRVLSSTFLLYTLCGIWSKNSGPAEVGFE
jgi:hypothetical protein